MIYLDHNATTPVAAEVKNAMMPYFSDDWGNPSSRYRFGSKLQSAIQKSRTLVADLVCAEPQEILFTCSATESNNAALHAALKANPQKRHIITSAVEHSSVLNYCLALEGEGYLVTYLPVDREGQLNVADLKKAITSDTAVVSVMWANNETGVLFPVEEVAQICASSSVLFHCDAVQVVGKIAIDLRSVPIAYLSLTGHKFNAPKGIGALYIRSGTPFTPYLFGGHQERGLRGGTENVALIVGIGVAAELARERLHEFDGKTRSLRDALEDGILSSISETELNGHKTRRLPNTTNITFHGIESEVLLLMLDHEDICASAGSACFAGSDDPSHVIKAMKPNSLASRQMVRFSLGPAETQKDIDRTISTIQSAVGIFRGQHLP